MKKLFMFTCLSFATATSWADCTAVSCDNVYVDRLYLNAAGSHLIQTSGDESKLTCASGGNTYLTIADTANKQDLLTLLLSAQITNKKLSIRIVDGSAGCNIAYIYQDRQ